MSERPLVSVILTSFNYAPYVRQAIESVLTQDYDPIELVIVDDCSIDGSQKVIEELCGSARLPTRIHFNDTNEGQGAAINRAYALTRGDVVSFLDSDDYWYSNRVSKLVEFLALAPGGGVYQHALNTGHGEKRGGMLSGDVFALLKLWDNGRFNVADDTTMSLVSPFVPTSGLVLRRDVLDRVMPIPAALTVCPDAYVTRTCIAFGPLYSLPLELGVWRDHGKNAGTTMASELESFWVPTVMPALNQFYARNGLGLELYFDRGNRSNIPASLMLGEYWRLLQDDSDSSVREVKEAEMRAKKRPPSVLKRALLGLANRVR